MTHGMPVTPPGWYPDPSGAGQLRYWTGNEWTQHVQPSPSSPGTFVRPWWQQWWAIILTLVVCFPFGLVGVWQRKGTSVGVKTAITVGLLILYSLSLYVRLHAAPGT